MTVSGIPKVRSVQIVAVSPEPADSRRLAFMRSEESTPVEEVVHLVKVYFDSPLPVTGSAFYLYVGDAWIRRYYGFNGGVYFNVDDPAFIQKHSGQTLRFTQDHIEFIDSQVVLPALADDNAVNFRLLSALEAAPVPSRLPSKRAALEQ